MKKQSKVHAMTKEQMKAIRLEMRFGLRDLQKIMKKWKYRTLQDYEGGQRAIPQEFADLLRAEQIKERQIKAELAAAMEARLDREYPNGIRADI